MELLKYVTKIKSCRISGSKNLIEVLNLGDQSLTGHFPRIDEPDPEFAPLRLVWSPDSKLLQLGDTYNAEKMYGENYGYRSGLNSSMVDHLKRKVNFLLNSFKKNSKSDLCVLDIGSNDGTLLNCYPSQFLRVGMDPTISKFNSYYDSDILKVADFFCSDTFIKTTKGIKADIITSIAMFYDLEDPISFAKQIKSVLKDDGIWHFEQSYLPSMLRTISYDTVCHEHLEYYSLFNIQQILEKAGLKVIDVSVNSINGGSFSVTACHQNKVAIKSPVIDWMLRQELRLGLDNPEIYRRFESDTYHHAQDLSDLLNTLNNSGETVLGYGASTKGNVLLQFCNLTNKIIPAIAEINPNKFGCKTPGTSIPIVSEEEAKTFKPDYFLVLPWHFRNGIINRELEYLKRGGKLIFPLPTIEIVG